MSELGRSTRVVLALLVAITTTLTGAAAAHAINSPGVWNARTSPLYVEHYGSEAWAAGSAYVSNGSNGTRIYNTGSHRFTDADNHRPYLTATSEWNAGSCSSVSPTVVYKGVEVGASASCAQAFYDGANFARADGITYTTTSWTAFPTKSAAPAGGSDRGRAKVRLCIDVPWRTDDCTGYSYSAADSF